MLYGKLRKIQKKNGVFSSYAEIEDDDDDDEVLHGRMNGASGDHERNNDSIFAELSRGKFGLEDVDDGASITGRYRVWGAAL